MSPSKITYTVGGKEGGSITAPDGVIAVLDTPVGKAFAVMRPSDPNRLKDFLTDLNAKFCARFPDDEEWIYPGTRASGGDALRRSRRYQTQDGEVVIYAEGVKG